LEAAPPSVFMIVRKSIATACPLFFRVGTTTTITSASA
jgi:hypothetical protein